MCGSFNKQHVLKVVFINDPVVEVFVSMITSSICIRTTFGLYVGWILMLTAIIEYKTKVNSGRKFRLQKVVQLCLELVERK